MAAMRKIDVQKPTDLETRLRYASHIAKVFASYIEQKGEIDDGCLVFAERAILLYRDTQLASKNMQTLRGQLLDLSWSLVTRMWSDPTDERHSLRERLAKKNGHPPMHDGTDGELRYFALRYVHLAKRASESSKTGDNWPEDVDELAKYLLRTLHECDPRPNPAQLAQRVFCVFGEGAPGIAQFGQAASPEQIDELSSAGALWLGVNVSE